MIDKGLTAARAFIVLIISLLSVLLSAGEPEAMAPAKRTTLPNGLVTLTSEEHSLPFVTMHLLIDAGSRKDPAEEEGLANLTVRGLLLGTTTHTLSAINEEIDFMGASLSTSVDLDFVTIRLKVLKKDLEKGFKLLTEVLTEPTFPGEEIQKEIQNTMAALQAEEDQPEEVADKKFRELLFLNGPYGHPVEGTRHSLPRLNREAVERFYRTHYHPSNAILGVVGDITAGEVEQILVSLLQQWPSGERPGEQYASSFAQGPETVTINRAITQANIIMGHEGVSRDNPDFYALAVMNYLMGGGGFGSRLMDEIRVKRGLAYYVQSVFESAKHPGSFQIMLQTKNSSAREAIALCRQQMERMQKELVSSPDLERAKKYLTGSFPLRLDTQEKLAAFLTQVEYYGLGLDYPEKYPSLIRAVTPEDVSRVAKTYLHPDRCITVVVANLKEAGLEDKKEN